MTTGHIPFSLFPWLLGSYLIPVWFMMFLIRIMSIPRTISGCFQLLILWVPEQYWVPLFSESYESLLNISISFYLEPFLCKVQWTCEGKMCAGWAEGHIYICVWFVFVPHFYSPCQHLISSDFFILCQFNVWKNYVILSLCLSDYSWHQVIFHIFISQLYVGLCLDNG